MSDDAKVDFDPYSPEYARDSLSINMRLRECQVAHSPHWGGFWSVARHADVIDAFRRDGKELSARHEVLDDGLVLGGVLLPPSPSHLGFMENDAPLHQAVRRLMNPWFTPEAVEELRPRIAAIASALLDARVESGELDAVVDLVEPLATFITFEIIGLPLDGIPRYSLPAQQHAGYDAQDADGASGDMFGVVTDALAAEVAQRRSSANAGPGLLGSLLDQTIEGAPIPDRLLVDSLMLFVIAGADTVGGVFSGAMHHLAHHTEDRRRLSENRSLLATAFEEFVRYETPTTQNARTALCDMELGGRPIARGDVVYLNLLSANHDEQRFDEPERIVVDRQPNPHVSFGFGAHRCVGAHLARVEWCVLMEIMLDRVRDWTLREEHPPRAPQRGISNYFLRMPIAFSPGSRIGSPADVLQDLEVAFPQRRWS